ncbi:MAG: hypothetical protein E6J26_03035 [Chloroflexi bacterium]|nr:MAG: hypothetical protein E6J26_03035 [Chloroflexota bacterium]
MSGIYVETSVPGSLDDLWSKTQTPDLHAGWDLRFTSIEYLPRADASQPQRFRYTTRIGLGLRISGEGETLATTADDQGRRTSALKFWSADPKSLIREGSGYWQYIPCAGGVRFLTWYDYRTRFGAAGRLCDRLIFRPLLGWATAWSFDRLRLWLERGLEPALALRLSAIHALVRLSLAFVWLYHGIVPKLLFVSRDELTLLLNTGLTPDAASLLLPLLGLAEAAFGLLMLWAWHARSLFLLNALLMLAVTLDVFVHSPGFLVAAFNPLTLNLAVAALALVGFMAGADIPNAGRCLRKRPESKA